jgi:hypothetical protein
MCTRAEVSKAFTCLSSPDKRAFYDRTGHEDSSSAAAAARGQQGGMYHAGAELSPEDLFNMMFGGMSGMGAFGMGPMHFGGFRAHPAFQQQRRRGEEPANGNTNRFTGASNPLQRMFQMVTAHPMRLFFFFTAIMQILPLLIGLLGWLWWALLLGVPVWFVSREITMFSRRPIYRPLQRVQPLMDLVQSLLPWAVWYVDMCSPVASVARQAQEMFVEWGRTLAAQ